jgi:hypothetical protein
MVRAKEGLFLLVHHHRKMFCKVEKATVDPWPLCVARVP